MNSQIDGFPVKDLPGRYGTGRTILYSRINALKIDLEKRSNRGYVSAKQLELLDALDSHIKNGGTTAQFLKSIGLYTDHREQLTKHIRLADLNGEHGTEQFSQVLTLQLLPTVIDPVDRCERNRRYLREAAEHGDILPTSHVLELLDMRSLPKHNGKFQRRGFVFAKLESQGKGCEWRISKLT